MTFQIDVYKVRLPWSKTEVRPGRAYQKPITKVIRKDSTEEQGGGIQAVGKLILRLTLKNKIIDVEVPNEPEIPAALAKFSEEVDYSRGDTFCIVSGIQTVRVVIDAKNLDKLAAALPPKNVRSVIPDLAEVIVTLSEAALKTPGVVATMSSELTRNGINIYEYVHATPHAIIEVEDKDALRTYQVLESLASGEKKELSR